MLLVIVGGVEVALERPSLHELARLLPHLAEVVESTGGRRRDPSSSSNSRRAAASGSSSGSYSPFGIDQAPSVALRPQRAAGVHEQHLERRRRAGGEAGSRRCSGHRGHRRRRSRGVVSSAQLPTRSAGRLIGGPQSVGLALPHDAEAGMPVRCAAAVSALNGLELKPAHAARARVERAGPRRVRARDRGREAPGRARTTGPGRALRLAGQSEAPDSSWPCFDQPHAAAARVGPSASIARSTPAATAATNCCSCPYSGP